MRKIPCKYKQKAAFAEYGNFSYSEHFAEQILWFLLASGHAYFTLVLRNSLRNPDPSAQKKLKALYRGFALSEQSYPRTPSKVGGQDRNLTYRCSLGVSILSVTFRWSLESASSRNKSLCKFSVFFWPSRKFNFYFRKTENLLGFLWKPTSRHV